MPPLNRTSPVESYQQAVLPPAVCKNSTRLPQFNELHRSIKHFHIGVRYLPFSKRTHVCVRGWLVIGTRYAYIWRTYAVTDLTFDRPEANNPSWGNLDFPLIRGILLFKLWTFRQFQILRVRSCSRILYRILYQFTFVFKTKFKLIFNLGELSNLIKFNFKKIFKLKKIILMFKLELIE